MRDNAALIELAGGAADDADLSAVALTQTLTHEGSARRATETGETAELAQQRQRLRSWMN